MFFQAIEFGTPAFDEAVRLRYEILRRPLGLEYTSEQIAAEWSEHHLVCFSPDFEVMAYLNLSPLDEKVVKMRQVAVSARLQRRGVGAGLVKFSEEFARERGFEKMTMHARETAVPFYKKLGYAVVGGQFEEVGIPHFKMEKKL